MDELTRRGFFKNALGAGGALALGLSCGRPDADSDPFAGGEWLGNIMPPAPTRIVEVPSAIWPTTTEVAALAIPGML